MDPTGPIAQRFPLLPRARPVCSPLTARVDEITKLAHAAVGQADPVKAAAVHNRAALIASDCGLPDLARTWCHQHAHLHLVNLPLTVLSGHASPSDIDAMLRHYQQLIPGPGLALFHTRLGLSVLDAADPKGNWDTRRLITTLIRQKIDIHDGYAARDFLAHRRSASLLTHADTAAAKATVRECALGTGKLPTSLYTRLVHALTTTATVLTSGASSAAASSTNPNPASSY